jgi:hypothetical protein
LAAHTGKRTPAKARRGLNAFAKRIVKSRDPLQWSKIRLGVYRMGQSFIGLPVDLCKIVEDSTPTFSLVSLSVVANEAKLQEMRALFVKLNAEYHAGTAGTADLYGMIRIIILAIIALQDVMIRKSRDYGDEALHFVEVIDNDNHFRTARMPPMVICLST